MDTNNTTLENNKLIAEFMGYDYEDNLASIWSTMYEGGHRNSQLMGDPKNYKYFHSDWNVLLEVVEKIKHLHKFGNSYYLSLMGTSLAMIVNQGIEPTYRNIVEFIKFYNSAQKEN